MKQEFANKFAAEWIAAWNSKALDKIMAHYTDDFSMSSPVIQQLMNEDTGQLVGKDLVRNYWAKALKANPQLHFTLINVFTGVNSLIINYQGHRGPACEIFYFNESGKVSRAAAHYAEDIGLIEKENANNANERK